MQAAERLAVEGREERLACVRRRGTASHCSPLRHRARRAAKRAHRLCRNSCTSSSAQAIKEVLRMAPGCCCWRCYCWRLVLLPNYPDAGMDHMRRGGGTTGLHAGQSSIWVACLGREATSVGCFEEDYHHKKSGRVRIVPRGLHPTARTRKALATSAVSLQQQVHRRCCSAKVVFALSLCSCFLLLFIIMLMLVILHDTQFATMHDMSQLAL